MMFASHLQFFLVQQALKENVTWTLAKRFTSQDKSIEILIQILVTHTKTANEQKIYFNDHQLIKLPFLPKSEVKRI